MDGEVRRVNIVYFLSRSGHVEHPHLMRAHHHTRNGVFLRDVKRWLADARGNAMPDAFCWSYKRRYKNGYVWQDLLDDDLITPISDNEYVLKGSEILSSPKERSPFVEKKTCGARNGDAPQESLQHSSSTESSRKSTSGIYKESPVFGSRISSATTATTVTDDSMINEDETSVLRSRNLNKSDEFQQLSRKNATEKGSGRPSVSSTSSKSSASYTRSKSYSSGASQVLRSLMTCGNLDINDTVLMPLNRFAKAPSYGDWEDEQKHHYQQQQHNARKSFDGAWSGLKMKEKMEFCRPKAAMGPICSQCGKSFKPEKMHSHMKLCRGMKNLNKSSSTYAWKAMSERQGISGERQYVLAVPSLKE